MALSPCSLQLGDNKTLLKAKWSSTIYLDKEVNQSILIEVSVYNYLLWKHWLDGWMSKVSSPS